MSRIVLTVSALLSLGAIAAGCGNAGSSASGAASLAPAGAVIYGEATLDPSEGQQAAIESLIAKFPGKGSAGERIRGLLEKAFSESDTGLSYSKDIEPWLGDKAGFFVSSLNPSADGTGGAFMVSTDDEGKARDAIEKAARANDGKASSYRGHDYYAISGGAAGVVDGWVVLGNSTGFKAAVDTAEGGAQLEDDDAYAKALGDAPEERLGFVYLNTPAFMDQLQKSGAGATLGPFAGLFKDPVLATFNATEHGVRLEATLPESISSVLPILGESGGRAADLPADSWLALAQPDLGKTISYFVDAFGAVAGGRDALEQQLKAATGLDLDRDVISWMGDWSLFVRGTSVDKLSGALVIETTDRAASRRFIGAIAQLARKGLNDRGSVGPLDVPGGGEGVTLRTPSVSEPIHLFQRDGKVVLAYGDSAAADAFDPGEKLGDTQAYKDAQAALGEDYDLSFYLGFEPIVALVDSTGAGDDEGWLKIKPYLEPLGALVVGARKDGDKIRSAFGLTVK
ncbi:MAG: hypothetical protein QOE60_959 [Thermoleophilaceae bacterium]|nr:hypothetical protein [Thermoleophilaceae bacterium]